MNIPTKIIRLLKAGTFLALTGGIAEGGVFQLQRVDQLLGFDQSSFGADSLNDNGEIGGRFREGSGATFRQSAFRTNGGVPEVFTDLGVPPIRSTGISSAFVSLNNSGDFTFRGVVTTTPDNPGRSFQYSDAGGLVDVGTAGGDTEVARRGINNLGQVVGASELGARDGPSRAFLFTPGSGFQDLGTLGGTFAEANGINDLGHVVGSSQVAFDIDQGSPAAPFIWTPEDGIQIITDVPGNTFSGGALDINESGWVVGQLRGDIFIRTAEGDFIPNVGEFIITTPGGNEINRTVGGAALKILEADFAAYGESSVNLDGRFPFDTEPWLWTEAGGTEFFDEFDLVGFNDDDWNFSGFIDANEMGLILARATFTPTGESFTVLLRPVPEPGTAALLLLATATALTRRRR